MTTNELYNAFEIHDAEAIRQAFREGMDPNTVVDGQPLVMKLIDMYLRGPGFTDCFRAFVEHGLQMEDKALQSVFLDDAETMDKLLSADTAILNKRYDFQCTFTPLYQATLLHVCAEYNLPRSAHVLMQHGANVDAPAGTDEHGFGGQSPIFHTVNQHRNACMDVLKLLLQHGASVSLPVKGLIWGKGYPWETYIPAADPVSYAMMGLLRQFQRTEADIYDVVGLLMKARFGLEYAPKNIPNQYLR